MLKELWLKLTHFEYEVEIHENEEYIHFQETSNRERAYKQSGTCIWSRTLSHEGLRICAWRYLSTSASAFTLSVPRYFDEIFFSFSRDIWEWSFQIDFLFLDILHRKWLDLKYRKLGG
jgi:hypothetical protein